jgi:hypothetical protein
MLRILQGLEASQFEGIATGDESWFRYSYPSSRMFARSPAVVIPRTRQAIGAKKTVIMSFFTARKTIVLDVLPKCYKYNQQSFAAYGFSGFEKERS